jgi:hypothetical protein
MSRQWSHLIRFLNSGVEYYGDAIFPPGTGVQDIVKLAESGRLRAWVVENHPITSGHVSNTELPVDKLLSPMTKAQVPVIRCIGLNYVKHSKFSRNRVDGRCERLTTSAMQLRK